MARYVQVPSVGASHAAASGSKSGESRTLFQSATPRCGRRQRARSRHHSSPRSKNSGESWLINLQLTQREKQLEQEVAAPSKLEEAYQRQHKAAVASCVFLAETGGKVKE